MSSYPNPSMDSGWRLANGVAVGAAVGDGAGSVADAEALGVTDGGCDASGVLQAATSVATAITEKTQGARDMGGFCNSRPAAGLRPCS